jgi:DNA-binding MarR family transcriptional regulator
MKQPNHDRTAAANEGMAALFTLTALLGDAMDTGLAAHGLTRARAEVIWTLHHQGAMTQRELSRALECSPPNVTGLLDGLEDAGFVTRERHPTDRRATLVKLTALGTRTTAGWSTEYMQFAATLFADLATSELRNFVDNLRRVLNRLTDAVPTRAVDTSP